MALGLVIGASGPLRAQTSAPRDPAGAEALYREGRELIGQGDWIGGCAKLEASLALMEQPTTLIVLARCRERAGKLTAARTDFERALALLELMAGDVARKVELASLARQGRADLDQRIPRLRIVVSPMPQGVVVLRDRVPVAPNLIGEEIHVDPGETLITAEAPGHLPFRRRLLLEERRSTEVTISLARLPAAVAPPPPAPTAPPPPPKPDAEGGTVPAWTWIVGGAGLALVAAGALFRVDAVSAEDRILENCGEDLACEPGAYDPADDNARKNRDYVLFVALTASGGIAVVTAVIGMATGAGAAKDDSARVHVGPVVGPSHGGVAVRGAF